MKLVFPGGEHPHRLLAQGINRVGPNADDSIQLAGLPRDGLCELHLTRHGLTLQVLPDASGVTVNGRAVAGVIALRAGDLVSFDGIDARVAERDPVAAAAASPDPHAPDDADPQATIVRPSLPSHLLRSVSDIGFGRSHTLLAATTIGRAPENGLPIDHAGLSRTHARVTPDAHGVVVEDLGSTNGTYLNGRRVTRAHAVNGDELRFDTLRFRVVAPVRAAVPATPASARARRASRWWWVAAALLAIAALGAAVPALT